MEEDQTEHFLDKTIINFLEFMETMFPNVDSGAILARTSNECMRKFLWDCKASGADLKETANTILEGTEKLLKDAVTKIETHWEECHKNAETIDSEA